MTGKDRDRKVEKGRKSRDTVNRDKKEKDWEKPIQIKEKKEGAVKGGGGMGGTVFRGGGGGGLLILKNKEARAG